MDDGAPTNGDRGVEHVECPTLIITLDPRTLLVSFRCDGIKVSVAQMMLDEVQRQLDIQRRQAAAIELQKQLADAARTKAIIDGLGMKG